jgi:hypothetical protein
MGAIYCSQNANFSFYTTDFLYNPKIPESKSITTSLMDGNHWTYSIVPIFHCVFFFIYLYSKLPSSIGGDCDFAIASAGENKATITGQIHNKPTIVGLACCK